jgi:hypothetical protein
MKVIKLTAAARDDIQSARKSALPNPSPDHYLYGDAYYRELHGLPDVVSVADALLTDTQLWEKSSAEPVIFRHDRDYHKIFGKYLDGTLILYQDCFYEVRAQLTDDQRRLLVLEAADKERQLFERLKAKFDSPVGTVGNSSRHRIPEAVRVAVWRRDQGHCATPGCHSRKNLEYDHIIPLDSGGSNTERNVELLCESCNRHKSNNIQ